MTKLSLALLLLPFVGCAGNSSFVRSDPAFKELARRELPAVFIERAPDRPYHSVGTIDVELPADEPLQRFVDVASSKGQQVGCDGILALTLPDHASLGPLPHPGLRLVHGDDGPERPERVERSDRPDRPDTTTQKQTYRCVMFDAVPSPRTSL